MPNPIVDSDARRAALAPDQSFIIQAPAGSGKTGLLIQRYLRLLALVDAPEEIIAITFTRKAAAEMQSRILAALNQAANNPGAPSLEHDNITFELATAALQRDQAKAWQIIDNPSRLRVQTIDSLCAYLTRQMPMLARLGTQPETLEDAEPLYQQAAIKTLAELESGAVWSASVAALILYMDNDLPRLKTLIVDMLKKRDQWLAYVVQAHDRNDMEQALTRLVEAQLSRTAALFPKAHASELLALLQFAANNLIKTEPDHPVAACLSIAAMPDSQIGSLDHWRGIAELLLTRAGTWRKQHTIKNGFPPASGNTPEAVARAQKKEQIQALLGVLQTVDGLQHSLAAINTLPPICYTDAEWSIVNATCELLKLAAAQLRVIFAERNQMDFIGIAESAVQALGQDAAPTELALQLDYQIKHLLVDEYQDISVNQYRLLQSLTREWSMDDGRSLFLVGDPMQSIYRFREAEVGLFIKTFHDAALGNMPLQALRLSVNFRSQSGLVDWVNDSFSSIFPQQDDLLTGAVSYNNATAFAKATANDNVKIHPCYGRVDTKEAQQVVEIMQEIKQGNPDDTIAVLVRSRSHLIQIVPALRQAQIAFKAIDIESLGAQAAIQDLLALTCAFLSEADRVAWLACLRAPWCGLTLASLHRLCDQNKHKTIWECLSDQALVKQLQPEQQTRLQKFKSIYATILQQRQRLPIRDAIESFWLQLGGPATLSNKTDLENCLSYLALLETLDQGSSIETLQTLVDAVDQLYAAPDLKADNQIQVMTIHKAKGLEFDHVILPGLGRSPRSDQGALLVWLLRQREEEHAELILAPIRAAGDSQAPIYDYIHNTDKTKQRHEDARLLYVAITRTRKTCHLIGHVRVQASRGELGCVPQNRSLLAHLWPRVQMIYEQHKPAQIAPSETESELVPNQATKRLRKGWQPPPLPAGVAVRQTLSDEAGEAPALIEFEWAGEIIKHVGSVTHRAIQRIAEEGLAQWTQARIQAERVGFGYALQQLGVPEGERPEAVQRVLTALRNMVHDERGQWILSVAHQQQRNEYPISGMLNDKLTHVILDRTFIDAAGCRWIIDYKLSRHEGANRDAFLDREQERYRAQMEKYGSLMKQFADPAINQNIRLGLYFPLLKGWREWRC